MIGIVHALLDVETTAVQLVLEGLGAEVLQPVVDGASARHFDNGVLVEDHLLVEVREGVEEAVIAVRRPETVQKIYLAGGELLMVRRCSGLSVQKSHMIIVTRSKRSSSFNSR